MATMMPPPAPARQWLYFVRSATGAASSWALSAAAVEFVRAMGGISSGSQGASDLAEANVQDRILKACKVVGIFCYISANTSDGLATLKLRKNGASQSLSITLAGTGAKSATSSSGISYAAGDTISLYGEGNGTTNNLTLTEWGVLLEEV